MEIIVKVNKYSDIRKLNNADAYILSNKHFSYRFDESFSEYKIQLACSYCHSINKKVYVLVNKIFFDEDLEKLKEFLVFLKESKVDGIFFTDFAVFMIAKELGIEDKCIFYHETFLRNSYDITTYQSYGINKIICSKDMNLEDINNLPVSSKNNYGILCFSYMPIYESKRKIISNYVKLNDLPKEMINSKNLFLKEETRDKLYRVLQQEGTSSIFDYKVLCYLENMDKLKEHINMFIFDSLFFDVSYIKKVINIFKKNKSMKELQALDESIEFSDEFLNRRIGLM